MHTTEADARIIIDDLLKQALWDPADKSQVLTEFHIHNVEAMGTRENRVAESVSEYGSDRDAAKDKPFSGRADYVLRNQNGRALAIIEAKKNAINPYVAKQQALPYAKAIGAPFIFLTNGELIYFGITGMTMPALLLLFFPEEILSALSSPIKTGNRWQRSIYRIITSARGRPAGFGPTSRRPCGPWIKRLNWESVDF